MGPLSWVEGQAGFEPAKGWAMSWGVKSPACATSPLPRIGPASGLGPLMQKLFERVFFTPCGASTHTRMCTRRSGDLRGFPLRGCTPGAPQGAPGGMFRLLPSRWAICKRSRYPLSYLLPKSPAISASAERPGTCRSPWRAGPDSNRQPPAVLRACLPKHFPPGSPPPGRRVDLLSGYLPNGFRSVCNGDFCVVLFRQNLGQYLRQSIDI